MFNCSFSNNWLCPFHQGQLSEAKVLLLLFEMSRYKFRFNWHLAAIDWHLSMPWYESSLNVWNSAMDLFFCVDDANTWKSALQCYKRKELHSTWFGRAQGYTWLVLMNSTECKDDFCLFTRKLTPLIMHHSRYFQTHNMTSKFLPTKSDKSDSAL